MNQVHPQRNKFLWLAGFLVLLAVIGFAVKYGVSKKAITTGTNPDGKKTDTAVGKNPPSVTIKEVPKDKLPEKLPTNLPTEVGAKITQNYSSTNATGDFQATRAYESKKTMAENKKIYTDFFAKDGWKVVAFLDESDYKVMTAIKGDLQMQLSLRQGISAQVVEVEQTITATPKAE